ncbi:MAG: DUF6701 domain-containing protein, partial [Duganella sp.]
ASAPHHFQITHGGSALTCQPQTVTVTACANAACTAPHYSASIKTTLQPGGAEFTVSGGANTAATVSRSTAGTAVLSASGGTNASTCVNTTAGNTSCDMAFSDNGLSLSVPDHVAMTTASVTVQALKSAPAPNAGKTCVPLVANATANISFSCKYVSPGADKAAKVPVLLKNSDAASYTSVACGGAGTAVPLKFNADGLATASLQYAEVGNVGLGASYTSGTVGASAPAATAFTAAPREFVVTASRKSTAALLAGYYEKAGVPFTVVVEARNAAGKVVTNFGQENTPENLTLAVKVTDPANGVGELLGPRGAITAGVSTSDLWFTETGMIEVTAQLARTSLNYMDLGVTGFDTKGRLALGYFAPQYYQTVLDSGNMACSGIQQANRPCPAATGMFTHAKQGFFIKVLAFNGAATPGVSANYTGTWAAPVTLAAMTKAGGKVVTPNATLGWTGGDAAPRFVFSQGTGTLAGGAGSKNLPVLTFAAKYPVATLPVTAYLRATDGNGVSSERAETPAAAVEAELTFVSGQLALGNAYGSQNAVAPVDATAQYYLAKGYVINPLVTVTSVPFGSFATFKKCTRAFDTGNGVCPAGLRIEDSNKTLQLTNGRGKFYVAPPKPALGGTGAADVSLGELIPYLPSATGSATFGIYRSGPVIYTREVY